MGGDEASREISTACVGVGLLCGLVVLLVVLYYVGVILSTIVLLLMVLWFLGYLLLLVLVLVLVVLCGIVILYFVNVVLSTTVLVLVVLLLNLGEAPISCVGVGGAMD